MSDNQLFPVPASVAADALVDNDRYQEMYDQSVTDPVGFWGEHGKRIDWIKPYTQVKDTDYDPDNLHVRWYYDGALNASTNCLDRHLADKGDQVAIIWEGDDPKDDKKITYRELHAEVCKFANGLKSIGAKKGDRITIYMPMIPEAAVAMLACTRIGAIHSVVFGGFSPDALAGRIQDCECNIVITADEGLRGGRPIPLKVNTDAALESCPTIKKCVVVKRTGQHRLEGRPRRLVSRPGGRRRRRLPAGGHGRRRPDVHPLHLRVDRQTQGCDAHHRWLHGLCLDDPRICLRLQTR